MIAAVISPEAAETLQLETAGVLGDHHTVGHISTRERDTQALAADLQSAARAAADVLLVDCDAGPPEALVQGVRQYRTTRPEARIILLALGREPGDPLVSAMVNLGIYDIIAGDDPATLPQALASALARPTATYASAARWHQAAVPLPGASQKKPPQPREAWRVLADRSRPYIIAVTGATTAAGTTDLSWHLAIRLARHGLSSLLLADVPESVLSVVRRRYVSPGLPLTVCSHDRQAAEHQMQAVTNWHYARGQPSHRSSRLRLALEPEDRTEVVIADLGSMWQAREHEGDLLAAADRVILCWPQSPIRLCQAAYAIEGQAQHITRLLERAIHCAYLATAGGASTVTRHVAELAGPAVDPITVAVPAGPYGPDLSPLLDVLAPSGDLQGRLGRQPLMVLTFRLGRRAGQAIVRRLPSLLRLTVALALLGAVLWAIAGAAQLAGAPLPDWTHADVIAALLRRVWSLVAT